MRIHHLTLIAILAVLALACGGGGGEQPAPTQTAAPTAAPSPTAEPAAAETLAFLRDGDIWLIDADARNERALGLSGVLSFSWVSADELDATTGTGQEQNGHVTVDLDGNATELRFPAGGSWSRDGTRYVTVVDEQLVVYDHDGAEVARLTVSPPSQPLPCDTPAPSGAPDQLLITTPVLSPDGQYVMAAVDCQSHMAAVGNLLAPVLVVPLDGKDQRRVGDAQVNIGSSVHTRFASDGKHAGLDDSFHLSACAGAHGLQVVDLESNEVTAVMPEALSSALRDPARSGEQRGGVIDFDWSPDGANVVASVDVSFCSDAATAPEPFLAGLFTFDADGSGETKVLDGPTHLPAWSPSGRYIAFVAQQNFGEVTEPSLLRVFDRLTGAANDLSEGTLPQWQPRQ